MKTKLILLAFIALSLFGALSGAPSANAVSDYDLAYRTEESVILTRTGCEPIDISESWTDIIYSISDGWETFAYNYDYRTQAGEDLTDAVVSGQHSVSSYYASSINPALGFIAKINFSVTQNGTLSFYDYGTRKSVITNDNDNTMQQVTIWMNASCQAKVYEYMRPTEFGFVSAEISNDISPLESAGSYINYYAQRFDVVYPPDYEGEEIVTSPFEPPDYLDFVPNFHISSITKYIATIHDINFNTFDANPFLCDDEFAPVINWSIYTSGDELITTGTQSATAPIIYTLPEVEGQAEYYITGKYTCEGEDEFLFEGRFDFTVDGNGNLLIDLYYECITDTFPFINVEQCVQNMWIFVELLSFGTFDFGNEYVAPTGCYDLVIIDSWINLEDPTVCPQFPSDIRNLVTPFVTLLLGMVTILFFTRKNDRWE